MIPSSHTIQYGNSKGRYITYQSSYLFVHFFMRNLKFPALLNFKSITFSFTCIDYAMPVILFG